MLDTDPEKPQPPSILTLPLEVFIRILEWAMDKGAFAEGRWYAHSALKVNRQLRQVALSAIFKTRHLIFDLPEFVPCRLTANDEWPSTIRVRDQYNSYVKAFSPLFLSPGVFGDRPKEMRDLRRIQACPFHLFGSIRIEVPAPDSNDPGKLIMAWNRLRWIAWILGNAKEGLPHVDLVFPETEDRSWFAEGKLKLSHPSFYTLRGSYEEEPSDLLLLVEALMSMRGARSIKIHTPAFEQLDSECQHSLQWLQSSAIKTCKWGRDIHSGWDDYCYVETLEEYELRFHRVLHSLDTSIASFLRLEQFASFNHFDEFKFLTLACCNWYFPTFDEVSYFMDQLLHCVLVMSPQGSHSCHCSILRLNRNICQDKTHCWNLAPMEDWRTRKFSTDARIKAEWHERESESASHSPQPYAGQGQILLENGQYAALEDLANANNPSGGSQAIPGGDFHTLIQAVTELDRHEGQDGRVSDEQDNRGNDTSENNNDHSALAEIAYDGCQCFDRTRRRWFKKYPTGIVHDTPSIQSAALSAVCRSVRSLRHFDFDYLQRRRP